MRRLEEPSLRLILRDDTGLRPSVRNALLVDWVRAAIGLDPIQGLKTIRNHRERRELYAEIEGDGNRRIGSGGARFPWETAQL